MSGFEIAGIALAAFPIAVNGLEHFVQGVQTIKYWRRYRIKLQGYAGMIESARVFYLDTLEELLNGIVESEDEIEALMAKPGGTTWNELHYEQRLKQRLGRSYDTYLRTLNTLVDSLSKLCEKLGVDMAGKVLWDDYSMIEREMKRIKVTLSKNIYKELLDEIDKANKDIREITHQNIYLEPIRRKSQAKRPIAELKLIRKYAASLYQVLVTGKAWKCGCKDHHLASLRLEPRPRTFEVAKAGSPSQYRFRILLSISHGAEDPPKTTSQWQEIEVAPFLDKTIKDPIDICPQNSSKSVKFAPVSGPITRTIISHHSFTDHECDLIADICTTLCASHDLKKAIGFLVDEDDNQHKHYVYRADTGIGSESQSRSLGELLSSTRQDSLTVSLSRGDRLQIAVTLASSVLQLDGTLWLKSEWSSNDIYFHEKDSKANQSTYSHPYLPWKYCVAASNVPCPVHPVKLEHLIDRSQVLLALGLTLVELCFGKTLLEMQKLADCDPNEDITKYRTARRLLNAIYDEMGTSYGDVVRRCLLQPFDVRHMSLDNEDLQQKVFDDVVTPLIQDLDNFNGMSKIT